MSRRGIKRPPHRVPHGTVAGYLWHSDQRRKGIDSPACPPCREAWRKYYAELRRRRKAQRRIMWHILMRVVRVSNNPQDVKDAERIINKYMTDEEREELFGEDEHNVPNR